MSLRTELIETASDLQSLGPAWLRLWEEVPCATPFQLPEWMITWWRNFGSGTLCAVSMWNGDDLAGIAPVYTSERRMLFIGTGISDYLDVLIRPEAEREGAELFFKTLIDDQRWDICDFQELKTTSPLVSFLPGSLAAHAETGLPCPLLKLPEKPEEILPPLSRLHRRSVRRCWKLLGEAGDYQFLTADAENLDSILDALFHLHESRWKERGSGGVLQGGEIRLFHREVSRALLRKGMLRLFALELNGGITSALYGFVWKSRFYCYLCGFDPRWERISPGKAIMHYAIENAIREGLRDFDFLRGGEKYKYLWGAKDDFNIRLLINQP